MLLRGLGDVCARYPAATPVAGRSKVDPSPMPSPWPLLSPGQRLVLALQPSLPSAWCTSMREESVCSRAIYYYLLTFLSWIATYYLANLATALEPLKTLGELQPRSPWQRLDQLGFSWQDCYTRRIPASARTDCGRRSPLTGRSRDTAPAVSRPSQPPPAAATADVAATPPAEPFTGFVSGHESGPISGTHQLPLDSLTAAFAVRLSERLFATRTTRHLCPSLIARDAAA